MASRRRAIAGGERLELGPGHHNALFLHGVFDQALRKALRRVGLPADEVPRKGHHPSRRDVADHPRQVLLRVPAQVAHQQHHLARQTRVPRHFDGAHQVLFAAREGRKGVGPELQRERGLGRLIRGSCDAPVGEDRQAQLGKRCRGDRHRLAAERRETFARPRLGIEQVVKRGR